MLHYCECSGSGGLGRPRRPKQRNPVGVVITNQTNLSTDINVCTSLYQGQRNVMIVPQGLGGGQSREGLVFLSGAPESRSPIRSTIAVSAINQGGQIDPILRKVLAKGPYSGLRLQPASSPPKSLRLMRHEHRSHSWLKDIIHEADELVEELTGLDKHLFGGGHQVKLRLPPKGLQALRVAVEFEPGEAIGTVHSIEIIQTDSDGRRGGIRAALVVV